MPRNKYPEETVKKILDVSLELFLEKGFEQTTVLDIVAKLGGLTRGAFYHHFKSKEEVLDAIFERISGENHPFQKAQNAEAVNGLERIKLAIKFGLLANFKDEQSNKISNLGLSLMSNPRFLIEQIKINQESAGLLTPMFEEGMTDGSIRSGNPKVMADLFMLLVNFWTFPSIFPSDKEELLAKFVLIKQIFDEIGCPIIDEEIEEMGVHALNALKK